ncbi:hypothetical protein ACM39_10885 [Chryseobacterium sp. FH2]|uniref:GLPGLI family protein n=1 Tax=Chryseobacterium sp. FH2 TaxID=1674291 RepID=UPI00065ABBA5|nr:GLPGLI family protein [Chryseobacterium sp. FH2]KMQ67841.1 hypothetical protein ACM39_10885 [Chryseobacterium sp. FH2]
MRKKIILLLLLCSLSLFGQNKGIIIEYDFYESYNLELHLHSSLKNDGNNSLFEISDTKGTEDSNTTSYDSNGNAIYSSQKKRKENRNVYKDFSNNTIISLMNGYNPHNYFIVEEQFPAFNWKIENEIREILGYSCKKASMSFKGRNYTAWFTTKIPISDGPWKFGGLPGLILELVDDHSLIKIEAIKIILNAENVNISLKKDEKYPKVSWDKYIESIDKDFENRLKYLKSKGTEMGAEVEFDSFYDSIEYSKHIKM